MSTSAERPEVDLEIFDGTLVVQMHAPSKNIKHIQGLCLNSLLAICSRPGTVSAESRFCMGYIQTRQPEDKCKIREKKGCGACCRVAPTVKIPSNWKRFFHINENKTEHFRLLA